MNAPGTRFMDPFTDFAFKRIFGSEPNKDLLIDFLNSIFEGRKRIVDLVYNKNEHPGGTEDSRTAIFDLLCTSEEGERFIIEMQKVKQVYFRDRCVYYTSSLISEQGRRGEEEWNYRLKEVYLIGLMDFCFEDTMPDKYLHNIRLTDTETNRLFYKKLGYIFIEIPKFNKAEGELESTMDNWLYVLRNMHRLEKIPVFLKRSVFSKLFKISEMSNLTQEEHILYIRSQMRKWDYQNGLDTAREEGMNAGLHMGREGGLKAGREEERMRIARKLKEQGVALAIISAASGLEVEQIELL